MDKERALALARVARDFSNRGLALIKEGNYLAGHALMKQAVEAGRESRQLINPSGITNTLARLTELKKNQG